MLDNKEQELTVAEIRGIFQINPTLERAVQARDLPIQSLQLARELAEKGPGGIIQASDYLHGVFGVMRACVNRDPFGEVPFIQGSDLVYQWPDPAQFQWGDIEKVKLLNKLLQDSDPNRLTVYNIQTGTKLQHRMDELPTSSPISEFESQILGMEETFKFNIPDLRALAGYQGAFIWQNEDMLPVFRGLRQAIQQFGTERDAFSEEKLRTYLDNLLGRLGNAHPLGMAFLRNPQLVV